MIQKGLFHASLAAVVALAGAAALHAQGQFINGDLIVSGSECVGFDCVNGESFGFDTIRLKENNLRIRFDDTSTAGSFPNVDWQLTANESANGGLNKFSIDDLSSSRIPFTIEASAPTHSLYVDDGGRIGIGTSTPVVEMHAVDGDTPALRLHQDGSSGFQTQVWDIAGNEAGFFVRDVTHASALVFRARPGAPASSIDIMSSGDVSFGSSSSGSLRDGSAASLFVRRTDGDASILVEDASAAQGFRTLFELRNNGSVGFELRNVAAGGVSWQFSSSGDGDFEVNDIGGGDPAELQLNAAGDLTIAGSLFSGGPTCGGGCDLVFDPGYELESIEEHAASMWRNRHLPAVGATAERAARFNVTEKVGGMLNELEKAHIYIERLNQNLRDKDEKIEAILAENEDLAARLERLERLVRDALE